MIATITTTHAMKKPLKLTNSMTKDKACRGGYSVNFSEKETTKYYKAKASI
ncbi:MAG: hypothetical protein JO327_10500 [Nitrososphaeraceae archaeon]|nr:hypothetical protein [Nitrososphaeraceae archaeon]MBV9668545.1 hypothetical protein [Nitrososphaeraceae archaeon]